MKKTKALLWGMVVAATISCGAMMALAMSKAEGSTVPGEEQAQIDQLIHNSMEQEDTPAEKIWETLSCQVASAGASGERYFNWIKEQLSTAEMLSAASKRVLQLDSPEALAALQKLMAEEHFEILTDSGRAESLTFSDDFFETRTLFIIRYYGGAYGFCPEDFIVAARLAGQELRFSVTCDLKQKNRALGMMNTEYWIFAEVPREDLEGKTTLSLSY